MKLLCLVLISSLAFFWTADAGCTDNSNCKDDECCIKDTHEGECRKLGKIDQECSPYVSSAYFFKCNCRKGLTCVPDDVPNPHGPGDPRNPFGNSGPGNSGHGNSGPDRFDMRDARKRKPDMFDLGYSGPDMFNPLHSGTPTRKSQSDGICK